MVNVKILFVLQCIQIISGYITESRFIYVSHNANSTDETDCGTIIHPCQDLQQAISTSNESDSILLDVQYIYTQNTTVKIPHTLTISSYCDSEGDNNCSRLAIIEFKTHKHLLETFSSFSISGNLTIENLSIKIFQTHQNDYILFTTTYDKNTSYSSNVTLRKSSVFVPVVEPDFAIFKTNFSIIFLEDCLFFSNVNTNYQHNNRKKGLLVKNENGAERIKRILYISRCKFVNFFLYIDASEIEMDFKIIKNTFLESGIIIFTDKQSRVEYHGNVFYDTDFNHAIGLEVNNEEVMGLSQLIIKGCYFEVTNIIIAGYYPANISISNITMKSSSIEIISYVYVLSLGKVIMKLADSKFEGPLTRFESVACRSVVIYNCEFKNTYRGAINIKNAGLVEIGNTHFNDNYISQNVMDIDFSTSILSIVTIKSNIIKISNCTFLNNTTPAWMPRAFYISFVNENPYENLLISNVTINSGNLDEIKNLVIFVEKLNNFSNAVIIRNTSLQCQHSDYYLQGDLKTTQNDYFQLWCTKCDGTSYNAFDRSYVEWNQAGNLLIHNTTCFPCPYQAFCVNGIKSKGNYWGITDQSGHVTFHQCPAFYCCPRLKKCNSYNACMNNRQGRLCGECKVNHSISLLSSNNKCVESEICKPKWWFWLIHGAGIVFAFVILLYYKDVFIHIKKTFSKSIFNRPSNQQALLKTETSSDTNDEMDASYLLTDKDRSTDQPTGQTSTMFSGLVKITFFFYQTASIIRINAPSRIEYKMPYFIDILTSFFNVKIDITSSDLIEICPFQTKIVAVMELFRLSVIFGVFFLIFAAMLVLKVIRNYRKTQHLRSKFMTRLKVGYVQLMTFGYASIAVICIRSIDCIEIDGAYYIFYQAELECYHQPWQIFAMVVIAVWVIPFPIVLFVGSRSLRSWRITPNEFLLIQTFPPTALAIIIKNHCRDNRLNQWSEQMFNERKHILNYLNEPFRELETKDDRLERTVWEPVLILRRLILIVITTFIRSPIMKLYPTGIILVLFTIHDYVTKPFKDPTLNFVQLISMSCLGILVLFNMFWALSINIDVLGNTEFYFFGEILLVLELIMLLTPICLVMFGAIFKLGKCVYKACLRKLD
ncbi:uncharacterized protein [Clytia hemisphaerica]|uniref:Uncharacterized protein n=1 Tax=Clytia hemisphaerica TaxID=252671 RepID=A0A7M5WLF3_9CNID